MGRVVDSSTWKFEMDECSPFRSRMYNCEGQYTNEERREKLKKNRKIWEELIACFHLILPEPHRKRKN
jgi:hypothetical protein